MSLSPNPGGKQKTDAQTMGPGRVSCGRAWNYQPKLPTPDEARAIASPGPTQFFRVAGGKRHADPVPLHAGVRASTVVSAARNLPAMTLPLLLASCPAFPQFHLPPGPQCHSSPASSSSTLSITTVASRPPHGLFSPSITSIVIIITTSFSSCTFYCGQRADQPENQGARHQRQASAVRYLLWCVTRQLISLCQWPVTLTLLLIAFANGKVPSIDIALNSVLEKSFLKTPSKKLSTEGQQLVGDLRDVIEKAKVLLLTKNHGNLLQDFIWQTQHIGAGNAVTPGAPVDKDTAKQHGNQALEGLRTLGELLVTNGEFRKLLSDATVLLRDIAGDAAQKTADKVNPSDEQLDAMDKPAPENTWHETPNLSKDNIKNQLKSNLPIGKKDVQDAAGDATQAAHPSGSRDPQDAANLAAHEQQTGQQTGLDAQAGAKTGAQNLKQKISDGTDEDQKQKARTPGLYVDNGPWSDEFNSLTEPPADQQAIDTLLRLAEEYTGHAKNVTAETTGAVKGAHDQDSLQLAETDLKIYTDANQDPELKQWFTDMDKFVRKCLKEQGYILQDESNDRWNELYDQGHFLLRERYSEHTDRISNEFKSIGDEFDADPENRAFASAMNKLFLDLGNDENGQPTFKPHLVKDLTDVIIPGIFESVRYVPIPRIEYSDPMVDAVIENLVIEGDNLAPNVAEFGSDNYWRWGRKGNASKNKNKVMLAVSGIQMDLRDVSYYIKKKEGFPGITDKGVMDIFLGGTGLSFKVAMETADKTDRHHFFKINTVSVDIKNMSIKMKQSNHKLLFNLFKPLLMRVMKPIIQKVAEQQIRANVTKADAFLYKVKAEADRAQEEAKNNPDPEHLENMYQRYFNGFQRELQKGQQKKEELKAKSEDKHVNVAITQHDSMFKNIQLPGGISTKATEYKELAAKGDRWESPVFSIGSAKESASLPRVSNPTRKSRHAAQGGLVGNKGSLQGTSASTGYSTSTGTGGGLLGANGTTSNSGGFANQVDNAFSAGTAGTAPGYGATAMMGLINGETEAFMLSNITPTPETVGKECEPEWFLDMVVEDTPDMALHRCICCAAMKN
nr:uncharacterized protein c32a11.02c [Quercus suber]